MVKIPIEVASSRIHLCQNDVEILFGKGYKLTPYYLLSQRTHFAAQEKLDLKKDNKILKEIRVLGPTKKESRIELTKTDALKLGLEPPIRSGKNLENSPGITLVGPEGKLHLKRGVILSQRHIHLDPENAKKLKLKNNQKVEIEIKGKRGLVFKNVLVRINPNYLWRFHIDSDEANAAGVKDGDLAYVLGIKPVRGLMWKRGL